MSNDFVLVKNRKVPTQIMIACMAAFGLIWWDSFHEVGRFVFFMDAASVLPYHESCSYGSCFAQQAGLVLGAVALMAVARKKAGVDLPKAMGAIYGTEFMLHGMYYCVVGIPLNLAMACVVYALISACFVFQVAFAVMLLFRIGVKSSVCVVAACLVCMGVVNSALFPYVADMFPSWSVGIAYGVCLAISFVFARILVPKVPSRKEFGSTTLAVPPVALSIHLVVYGFVLGVLHTLSGGLATGPANINAPLFVSSFISAAILVTMFLRKGGNTELWSKMRSTVFPLIVIGFMLVPLVPDSDIALAVSGSGQLLYESVLIIACVALAGRTWVGVLFIVAAAMLYKSAGFAVGVALTVLADPLSLAADENLVSVISVLLTIALTAATFWVGSDEKVRRIWGLRKNFSPKRYDESVLRAKCARLAQDRHLTARESEVLFLLARGKRAAEVKEEMHVSMATVRSHIQHLYAKLDVHSIDELQLTLRSILVDEKELKL